MLVAWKRDASSVVPSAKRADQRPLSPLCQTDPVRPEGVTAVFAPCSGLKVTLPAGAVNVVGAAWSKVSGRSEISGMCD